MEVNGKALTTAAIGLFALVLTQDAAKQDLEKRVAVVEDRIKLLSEAVVEANRSIQLLERKCFKEFGLEWLCVLDNGVTLSLESRRMNLGDMLSLSTNLGFLPPELYQLIVDNKSQEAFKWSKGDLLKATIKNETHNSVVLTEENIKSFGSECKLVVEKNKCEAIYPIVFRVELEFGDIQQLKMIHEGKDYKFMLVRAKDRTVVR